jgi:hypothetical protein
MPRGLSFVGLSRTILFVSGSFIADPWFAVVRFVFVEFFILMFSFFAGIVVTACGCCSFLSSLPATAVIFTSQCANRPENRSVIIEFIFISRIGVCGVRWNAGAAIDL